MTDEAHFSIKTTNGHEGRKKQKRKRLHRYETRKVWRQESAGVLVFLLREKREMKKIVRWGMGAFWLVFLVLSSPAWAKPLNIDRYVIGDRKDWGFPAPYFHYPRGPGYLRMSMVFDTLIWKDAKGFVPMLATSWRYEPKRLTYTFDLNPKARWHGGRPVTAEDVTFTIIYMKQHPYPWIDLSHVAGATAVAEHRVVIQLTRPYAPFLEDVAGSMPILPRHIWKGTTPQTIDRKKAGIGCGPFILKAYDAAQGAYAFAANPRYYRGTVMVKSLRFQKVNDPVFALLRKDIQAAVVPPEAGALLRRKGYTVVSSPTYWVLKLLINHRRSPMNELRFRRALLYAIDRKLLVKTVLHGFGTVASLGLLPPQSPWFNPNLPKIACDPAKARELLKVFPRPRPLTLLAPGRFNRAAERIRQDFGRVGIRVTVQTMEETAIDAMIQKGGFDLALSGHGGLGGDPRILNDVIAGDFLLSERFTEDPRLNALLKKNLEAMDPKKRHKIVDEIQLIHARQIPAIPLYYPMMTVAHDGRVPWFYTRGGISKGIPFPFNKDALIRKEP